MREELHPHGVEVVDVCLEMGGAEIARPYVEAAGSTHPSLIDPAHLLDARFGVTNIPMVMWIDETGAIVRPPEAASPPAVGAPAERSSKLVGDGERRQKYAERLRDWVTNGASSEYVLSPEDVIARSQPRSRDESKSRGPLRAGPAHLAARGPQRAGADSLQRRTRAPADQHHLQASGVLGPWASSDPATMNGDVSGRRPRRAKTGRSCPTSTRTSWPTTRLLRRSSASS